VTATTYQNFVFNNQTFRNAINYIIYSYIHTALQLADFVSGELSPVLRRATTHPHPMLFAIRQYPSSQAAIAITSKLMLEARIRGFYFERTRWWRLWCCIAKHVLAYPFTPGGYARERFAGIWSLVGSYQPDIALACNLGTIPMRS
jgi:hypothetical protein